MTDWDTKRAKLNHDVLKNQLLPTLDRMKRIAEGKVSGDGLLDECCDQLSQIWCELLSGLQALLKQAETGSMLCSWFNAPPLNRLDEQDARWMQELVYSHYPNSIEAKAKQALIELTNINKSIKHLIGIALECSNSENVPENIDKINEVETITLTNLISVRFQVSNLSEKLSSMSTNIMIQCLPDNFGGDILESHNKNFVPSICKSSREV